MSQPFSLSLPRSGNSQRYLVWLYGFGLSLMVVAPLLPNHYPPWIGFHAEAAAFAGWLSLATYVILGAQSSLKVPFSSLAPLLLSFGLWLQYLFGKILFFGDAATSTTYLVCASVLIIAGANLESRTTDTPDVFSHVSWAIVLSALVSSLLALVQWFRQEELIGLFISNVEPSGRPYANLNQPNHLATYILLGLSAGVYLYERIKISRLALVIFSSLNLIALLMTESRAAVISLGALLGWFLFARSRVQMRIQLSSVVAWATVFLVGWSSWSSICKFFLLEQSRETSFTNSSGRFHMWNQIVHGIFESPWLGFGWHNTPAAQLAGSATIPSLSGQSLTDYSHNIFLDLIVWLGIPAGVFLSLVFLVWLFKRLAAAKMDLYGAFACALCLPIVIHSMFEFPFAYSYFLMPFCFFSGVLEKGAQHTRLAVRKRYIAASLSVLGLAMLCMLVEYLAAEEDYRIQRYETLHVGNRPQGYAPSKITIQTQLAGGLEAAKFEPHKKMTTEELNRIHALTRRFLSAELQIKYAKALELNGMHEDAKLALSELTNTYGVQWASRGAQALKDAER